MVSASVGVGTPGYVRSARDRTKLWYVVGVGIVLCVPMCVACVWLRLGTWSPVFDMALFEMLVRDVGSRHTPLLGLGGRLSRWPEVGCHPGPLAFYLFAPLYRLFGGSYWALRFTITIYNSLAIAAALAIARRHAGLRGVFVAGFMIGLLELGFGLLVLTEPWNPYVPVLWFFTFLFSIWSVLQGDSKLLPVAAGIGTACAQTHIPYLPVCGGVSLVAFLVVLGRWYQTRSKHRIARTHARSCLLSVALTFLLWLPPIIDEYSRPRGNFTVVWEYLHDPPEPLVGLRQAAELVVSHLDISYLLIYGFKIPGLLHMPLMPEGSLRYGLLVLVIWVMAAAYALVRRERALVTLHATVAATLVMSVFSASRIVGFPYIYVLFSCWTTGAVAWMGILLTLLRFADARDLLRGRHLTPVLGGLSLVALSVSAARVSSRVRESAARDVRSSEQLGLLAPSVARVLAARSKGPYLVTWADALYAGGQGMGLINELRRYGLKAYGTPGYAIILGKHRVMNPARAVARIHIANGGWIADAVNTPGALEIAYADPRPPALRKEYAQTRALIVDRLREVGRADLEPQIDRNLGAVQVPEIGPWVGMGVARLGEMGLPAAVFLMPPDNG